MFHKYETLRIFQKHNKKHGEGYDEGRRRQAKIHQCRTTKRPGDADPANLPPEHVGIRLGALIFFQDIDRHPVNSDIFNCPKKVRQKAKCRQQLVTLFRIRR